MIEFKRIFRGKTRERISKFYPGFKVDGDANVVCYIRDEWDSRRSQHKITVTPMSLVALRDACQKALDKINEGTVS